MTIGKNLRRPLLRLGKSPKLTRELIADLEACFRGETASAWCVILPGPDYSEEIRERWRQWKAAHPDARPPAWLSDMLGNR